MAIRFNQHQLSNGLTILAECDAQAHTAAVGFFVRAGARDEHPAVMGVSHFLEHMMFKGTERRTADDVNREFDEIGANYNAFTSQENTVYHAHVLPEFLPHAVDLFCDMLRPALRADDFEVEKKVILEEIGMYEDRPHWRLHDALLENHFGKHPLGHRVLGTNDTIGALTAEQMRAYFRQWYSPRNITVAAAGRVDFDRLVEDVTKAAEAWEPTDAERQFEAPKLESRVDDIVDPKLSRHYVAMICPAPAAQDQRRYAATVIADVLGDDDGSRIYWALVDPGLCDEAGLSYQPQDGSGCFMADAACEPGMARKVEKLLLETIDHYVNDIDDTEIERSRNKLATRATIAGELPHGRMQHLGGQWTYLGQYIPLAEEIDRIMEVTVDDVRSLLEDMPFEPRTILRLGPK